MRVQTKILLVLVPLVVAPLLTLGWTAYDQLRTTAEQKTLDQMDTLLNQVDRQVQDHLRTTRANLELFSESVLLQSYLLTEDEESRYTLLQPTLLRLFGSYQKSYPDYYEIRILLPDGYEDTRLIAGGLRNITDEEGESPFFQAASNYPQDIYSTYLHNPDNGEPALVATKRINLRDQMQSPITATPTLRGYLGLTVSLAFMEEQMRFNRIGREGHLFFTNGAGERLLTIDAGQPYPTQHIGELIAAGGGETRVQLEGKNTILKGRLLHPELALFAELSEDELLEEGRQLGLAVAAITLGAILFTTMLLFLLLRALLVKPLQQLNEAAKAIGQGNLDTRIEFQSRDEIGELARSFQEMSDNVRESHNQIRHLAYHDSLTSLPNRFAFQERLQQTLADANRYGYRLGVLFLDLDNFKGVNDTLGHQAGDALLRGFAERLVECLRDSDCVARSDESVDSDDMLARLGGDEFIIMLSHISNALAEVEELLLAQKPFISDYSYVALSEESTLVTGETAMAMVYSGDALMLQEYSENIAYVIPEEGTSLWVDYMVVSRTASNPRLAWAFINFLNEPENAARHAEYLYAPTCNKAAEKLLPAELLEDPQIYPDPATLAKSEAYKRLPPRAAKRRNEVFSRLVD